MQKALIELRRFENKNDIQKKILEFLEKKKGYGVAFNDIEFFLINIKDNGIKMGGNFFLNNILRNLVEEHKINIIISRGKEYYYIE